MKIFLLLFILVAPVGFISNHAEAARIWDNADNGWYVGSDDHGRGDVIGAASDFAIDYMDIEFTQNTINVQIRTNFEKGTYFGQEMDYGDFFISTDGWTPDGVAPYYSDNSSTGEQWEYVFDVSEGKLYDIEDVTIRNSEYFLGSTGLIFRNGQEVEIESFGAHLSSTTGGVYDSANGLYSFDIDFEGISILAGLDLGFHWATASCANDVIEGSVTAPAPEPTTMLLLGTGLIGLAGVSRKKSKN